MLRRETRWALKELLGFRIALVSIALSLVLLAVYSTKYFVDTANLRRLTLEMETAAIADALRHGQNPATREHYKKFPDAYAFRVYSGRDPVTGHLAYSANVHLFDRFRAAPLDDAPASRDEIREGLLPSTGANVDQDRWMLTDHEDIGGHSYWIQVALIGDPARLWLTVMRNEMLDHVVVPVLIVLPALALAIMLTIIIALRPLERTARQAAALGAAVGSGARLTPLSIEKLPLELFEVVSAINAMLAKLERAFELQKQFTSDAAHELRTPLAVLLLQVDELQPGPAASAIRAGLKDLSALIGQLLVFAQAEDTAKEESLPTDIVSIARKVCEELAATAYSRRQVIEFDAPEKAHPVKGHPALIEIALRNLLDNAIKHSPEGTAISVESDGIGRVTIADRGPGIRPDHKDLIFERFWRADRRHNGGAGIGLALVRRIAELHGGQVRVEDRAGGGARFILDFSAGATEAVKSAA